MANISRIKLDETTYEIKDAQAARASDLALKQDALTAGNGIAIDNSDVIRTTGIPFGTCDSTSTSKVFTATVPGIYKLEDGVCCIIKNGVVTSESGFTLNVNGLGAKPSYSNMATGNDVTPTDPTRDTTIFNINYAMLFVYSSTIVDGGGWICYRGYDANTNTIGYQVRTNSQSLPASQKFYRYRLLFTSADGTHYVPSNTSSSTNATSSRTVNQTPIDPFGPITYYGTTAAVEANARPAASSLWIIYTLNLGYSFNRTGAALTLSSWAPVYVKCAPQSNGSAIIDADNPYVQALPTTNDGKIYIFLGIAYSATNIELLNNHPVYYHDGTGIKLWMGGAIPSQSDIDAAKPFIITITPTYGEPTTYSADKTFTEITSAYDDGRDLLVNCENYYYNLKHVSDNKTLFDFELIDSENRVGQLFTITAQSIAYEEYYYQSPLTFDNLPTANSNNPVKSGGVYTTLANKADKTLFGVLTASYDNEDRVTGYTCDKTYSELYNAIINGTQVLLYEGDEWGCYLYPTDVSDGLSFKSFFVGDSRFYVNIDDQNVISWGSREYQRRLTFDNTPTQNSNNPVKSGGVYSALQGKEDSNITLINLFWSEDISDPLIFKDANLNILTHSQVKDIFDDPSKNVQVLHDDSQGFFKLIDFGTNYNSSSTYYILNKFGTPVPIELGLDYSGNEFIVDTFTPLLPTPLDIGAVPTAISTNYSSLVIKRNISQLIAGAWYRITDYTCTTTQTDTRSAGHQFDILVQATSPNTLSEEAKAIRHEGDTYFANDNLEAWKIWYCLDNDTTRFTWADTTNGKGVIYRMIDEHDNDCPYDFKNIQFKRYKITATTKTDTSLVGKYMAVATTMIGHTVDANDFVWCYTFNGYYASWNQDDEYIDVGNLGSDAVDLSNFNYSSFYDENSSAQGCTGNVIPYYIDGDSTSQPRISLNNIVMYGWVTDVSTLPSDYEDLYGDLIFQMMSTPYSNTFGYICCYITFGYGCYSNTLGNYCYYNTFGGTCRFNTFGNGCQYNTFGDRYNSNTFGNSCYSNAFGDNCHSNIFGNNCYSNTFGDNCHSNTFGDNCPYSAFGDSCNSNTCGNAFQYNIFGDSCNSNTFGNSCYHNTLVDSCSYNTFGNSCTYNTFENHCTYNTFGEGCSNNTFSKPYTQNVIVENRNIKITLTSSQTPAGLRPLRNITIAQGVNNTDTTKTISHNTLNDTFRTTYTVDDNGDIYAITPTKYDEWDNKQSALVSGTNIKTINNQSLLGSGNLTPSDIGADVFVVNIENDGNDGYTCDKTNAEIHTAWQDGRNIIAIYVGEFVYPITSEPSSTFVTFAGCQYDQPLQIDSFSINTNNNVQTVIRDSYASQEALESGTNIKTINNQSLLGSGNLTANDIGAATVSDVNTAISNLVDSAPSTLNTLNELATALGNDPNFATTVTNKIAAQQVHVGSVAGKLYRNNVAGSGNFTVTGNSGCIPNLTAGTFLVSIYAKSATQSYTFRFNFGSVTYDLSTTNGEISDVRQITIPSSGTFSGLVLNGSVASGTILYVVMYNYLTPISTVGPAAVTNRYADLDGTPTIPTVNNGTLTIQRNGTTLGTFTANLSSNTTANINVPILTSVTVSGTGAVTQALDSNKFYKFGSLTSLTLTLNAASEGLAIYGGKFTADSSGCTLSIPSTVTAASSVPTILGGSTYEFNIMDNVLLMIEI